MNSLHNIFSISSSTCLTVSTVRKKAVKLNHSLIPVSKWMKIMTKVNLLSPGRCGSNFKSIIFEDMLQIRFMSISSEIAFRWMPQNILGDKWTLVEVSHYLSQSCPRSMSPYGITWPQWVNVFHHNMMTSHIHQPFITFYLHSYVGTSCISVETLTHWGLVMPFGDINLGQHWLR